MSDFEHFRRFIKEQGSAEFKSIAIEFCKRGGLKISVVMKTGKIKSQTCSDLKANEVSRIILTRIFDISNKPGIDQQDAIAELTASLQNGFDHRTNVRIGADVIKQWRVQYDMPLSSLKRR